MKIEVGKYYRTRDGRKEGPIGYNPNITNYGKFFSGETFWDEFGRLYQATKETDHDLIAEWTEDETGTLAELDVKPGDVVELVRGISNMYNGHTYTIQQDGKILDNNGSGQYYGFVDDFVDGICYDVTFRIISRSSDTPKTSSKSWPHNGEWSNWFMSGVDGTIKNSLMHGEECEVETQKLAGCKQVAYRFRIKPKPVRETVTLYADFGGIKSMCDIKPIGTIDLEDGNPDLDSIKMEEV